MLGIYFIVFVVASTFSSPTDMQLVEKSNKRKMQNNEAAKKSYKSKKKEREYLQKKNAELEQIQKGLLHSKCQLETTLRQLQRVAEAMIHSYSTCKPRGEEEPKSQPNDSNNIIREDNRQFDSDVNTCLPLDLSVNSKHSSYHQDTPSNKSRQNPGYYIEADCADKDSNKLVVKDRVPDKKITATPEKITEIKQEVDIKKEVDIKQEVDIEPVVDTEPVVDNEPVADIAPSPKRIKQEAIY